jgi:diguanylate cyclase (GGDEF)-like protein
MLAVSSSQAPEPADEPAHEPADRAEVTPSGPPEQQWSRLQRLLTEVLRTDDEMGLVSSAALAALDLLAASSVSVSRFDHERGTLQVLVNVGELAPHERPRPDDEIYPMTQRPTVRTMVRTQRPWTVVVGDPYAGEEQETLADLGRHAVLACPVLLADRMWGELYVTRRVRRSFSDGELAVAEAVASVLALALDRLSGTEELRRLAYADALTGLGNRRRADELVEQALEQGRAVVIALFDVDGMKAVNDREGHAAGDRLLRSVGVLLAEAAAAFPTGHSVRLGGDEFALVVIDGDPVAVAAAAEGAVEAATDDLRDTGLSAGIASSYDLVGLTPAPRAVFRLADAALYRAKRSGGRRLMSQRTVGRGDVLVPTARQLGLRGLSAATQAVLEDPAGSRHLQALVDVAVQAAAELNAAAWWVSLAPVGCEVLADVAGGIDRDPQERPSVAEVPVRSYRLSDYPATAQAVRGGGSWVSLHDPDADHEETAFLAEFGYRANLMAGRTCPQAHRWLVEVLLDSLSSDPDSPEELVRRLTQEVGTAVADPV